jgi:nucleoside 2-deoxyribosyltransferase
VREFVVYIAGPYRGKDNWEIEQNIRRAEELALDVWRAGFTALCPHTNTRHFQGALPDEAWLDGDLAMLERCDAVLMTPDWHRSQGAVAERDHAFNKAINVFYSIGELNAYYEN